MQLDTCVCVCHPNGGYTPCLPCCTTNAADGDVAQPEIPPTELPTDVKLPEDHIKTPTGDHDVEYTYPRPTTIWPRPFTQRQFAKLLIMRGKVRAEREQA